MEQPTPPETHFHKILVPLDGSATAEQALPVAAAIARRSGASLHLVTVHVPVPFPATAEEPLVDGELDRALRAQDDAYLASTATTIGATHGVSVTVAVLDGRPAHTLAEHARVHQADLVVMTTHGYGGVSRLWLGSVTDQLLRRITTPVLVLHRHEGALPTAFRHIVVALDGSSDSARALEPAIALGTLTPGARYTLLHVFEPPVTLVTRMAMQPVPMHPHWEEVQENAARSYLAHMAECLRNRHLPVTTQLLTARGIGDHIIEFARTCGADLIAVGTHGARGMERLLLGSVADKVIRGATQAVLVTPARAECP